MLKKNEQLRNRPNILRPPRTRKWLFSTLLMAGTAISFSAQCTELNFSCTATSLMSPTIWTSTKTIVNNRADRRETQVFNTAIHNETILDSQGTTVATPELLSLFRASLNWNIRYRYIDNQSVQHYVIFEIDPDTGKIKSTGTTVQGPKWLGYTGGFGPSGNAIILAPNITLLDDVSRTLRFGFSSTQTVRAMPSTLPVVGNNEYANRTITYTAVFNGVDVQISNQVAEGFGQPPGPMTFVTTPTNNITTITCTRDATPLTLTLGQSTIDFSTVTLGGATQTRPLTWSTSGTGQAGTWTLTFDSATKTANYINLGGTNISILDAASNQVPLGTPVNISGTSGSYTLSLDPSTGTDGTKSANLSVTVTAN